MQGGTPEPDSTLPPTATTTGTIAADLMPASQGGVHHQHQASKSPSHKIKKAQLDDSNSSRATLFLIGDGSVSFRSLTPTAFHTPQFTSTPEKAMTKARAYSLSRDSDSLAGPHDQMEVFLMYFGQSLPPTTLVSSISGSQLVSGSMYAPPFPPTTLRHHTELGTSGGTLHARLQMQAPQCQPCTQLLPALWGRGCEQVASSSCHPGDPVQAPRDTSNAWEESYAPLLTHVTKFNAKLGTYLGDANKDMTDKAKEIWMCIQAMATALDMSPNMHLGLTLFLLD